MGPRHAAQKAFFIVSYEYPPSFPYLKYVSDDPNYHAKCLCGFDSLANGIVHQPVIKFGILIEEEEVESNDLEGSCLLEWNDESKNFQPRNYISMVENQSTRARQAII